MKNEDVIAKYRTIQRRVTVRLSFGFLAAVATGFLWLLFYDEYLPKSGAILFGGFSVIFLGAFFWVTRIDREITCPACKKSFMNVDGDTGSYIYLKECPYCKVVLK